MRATRTVGDVVADVVVGGDDVPLSLSLCIFVGRVTVPSVLSQRERDLLFERGGHNGMETGENRGILTDRFPRAGVA